MRSHRPVWLAVLTAALVAALALALVPGAQATDKKGATTSGDTLLYAGPPPSRSTPARPPRWRRST